LQRCKERYLLAFVIVRQHLGSTHCIATSDQLREGNATPSLEDIPRLLSEADAQPEPNKSLSKVNIGSLLLTYGKVDWARNVAADIDESLLTPQGYIDYARLKGGIALRDGEPFVAKRILTSQKVETRLLQVPPENRIGLYDQRAALFSRPGFSGVKPRPSLANPHGPTTGRPGA